jgi:ADP-heptose:LPS heptosyltransferase
MPAGAPSNLPGWVPTPARLSGFVWSAKTAFAAGGLPDVAIYFNGGLGDDIMCSAVARELKKRGARKVWQLTSFRELLAGNPDLIAVPNDFRLRRLCSLFAVPFFELDYPSPPPRHLIVMMCEMAGIRGEIDLRPYVALSEAERRAGQIASRPQIVMQTSVLAARHPMRNKIWPPQRFQAIAEALHDDFDIVQLGAPSDPLLDGVIDLRGKTSVRQAAAILAASRLFVGLVSGLMHLARAVDCRSVIVYGGREHPSQSGYSANENLYWSGRCAPCWQRNDCDYDRVCMSDILPEHAIAAARRQLDRRGSALAIDRVDIPTER